MDVRAQPASVCVNRENPTQVLVCFDEGPPELLDISKGTSRPVPCVPVGQPPLSMLTGLDCGHLGTWQRTPCTAACAA